MKTLIIFFELTFLTSIGFAQREPIDNTKITEIENYVNNRVKQDLFSGVILIAHEDKIVFENAYGFANKQENITNNIKTKFNLASLNKTWTALGISQLNEKGELSYLDKITKHLSKLPAKTFDEITIEHLLTHTSGLGDIFAYPDFFKIKDTAKTLQPYLNLFINDTLKYMPGTKFSYSNCGYILLGILIEELSNKSYYDYVKENILKISKMTNSGFYESDMNTENLALGYLFPMPEPGQKPSSPSPDAKRVSNKGMLEVKGTSAGGAYSTIRDLYKFSLAIQNNKLISQEGFANLTKGRYILPTPPSPRNAPKLPEIKYGYGFGEFYVNGKRIVGHNGGAPGVDVVMDIYTDLNYTVIILSNYDKSVMPIINFIRGVLTK